jgi:hypothetical protein
LKVDASTTLAFLVSKENFNFKENTMENPYVISAELDLAGNNLDQKIKQESIETFRENLDADLRAMGKDTLWVPSSTIKAGLEKAVANTNLPVVSLDHRYVSSGDYYLGISRGVNALLNDNGYASRLSYPSIQNQLRGASTLGGEIVLFDDVLFSGEMVSWLSDSFKSYGVRVGAVIVGIAIREGIEKLEAEGIRVEATEIFEEVEDEICERDFAVVPGSGRRIDSLNSSALYFDRDYGKPVSWASLTEDSVEDFCVNSIERSMDLLRPDTPMTALGNFFGYGTKGTAVDQLQLRLRSLS